MAQITKTEYGYRNYNQGWGELSTKTYYEDSSKVMNELYAEFGERLWSSINPTTPTKTTILLSKVGTSDCREIEVIIEEGK